MPGEAIAGFDQEILLVGALDERKIRIRISNYYKFTKSSVDYKLTPRIAR
jgi:hypothetical protein